MENTKKVRWLKALIKEMAVRQHLCKLGRKTVHCQDEAKAARETVKLSAESCGFEVIKNAAKITAMLNLYAELRGKEHRHGIPKGWEYLYERALTGLREEQAKVA